MRGFSRWSVCGGLAGWQNRNGCRPVAVPMPMWGWFAAWLALKSRVVQAARRTGGGMDSQGQPHSDSTALRARAVVPWHALVAAALLSLALGAALREGLAGERSSVTPAVRS